MASLVTVSFGLVAGYAGRRTGSHGNGKSVVDGDTVENCWRSFQALPERGGIGIFNRSYYEEVLVVRVHPEMLDLQRPPPEAKEKGIWKHRSDEINNCERYLVRNEVV